MVTKAACDVKRAIPLSRCSFGVLDASNTRKGWDHHDTTVQTMSFTWMNVEEAIVRILITGNRVRGQNG